MKNSIIFAFIAILCVVSFQSFAQKSALHIGQKLPVKSINNVFNYRSKTFQFDNARGKILILDFWSTWCSACIRGLKRLDSLQKKFPTQLLIVPVNYQSKKVVENFWQTNPIVKNLKIMTITDDKVLTKLFPHYGLPFEVWFDQDGKYLGSTNLEWVNEREITKILNGFSPNWVQATKKIDHNFAKPLIGSVNNNTKAYSTILNYLPNEREDQIKEHGSNNLFSITCVNTNVLGLYYSSLKSHPDLMDSKRLRIEVHDSTRLRYYPIAGYRTLWDKLNKFCYELKWPISSGKLEDGYAKMRSDLDLFFNFKSEIKKTKTKCYKLIRNESSDGTSKSGKLINQNSLATIVGYLNSIDRFPIIIADESLDLKDKIDFELNSDSNIDSVNKMLQVNGYQLIPVEENLDFFILKDR